MGSRLSHESNLSHPVPHAGDVLVPHCAALCLRRIAFRCRFTTGAGAVECDLMVCGRKAFGQVAAQVFTRRRDVQNPFTACAMEVVVMIQFVALKAVRLPRQIHLFEPTAFHESIDRSIHRSHSQSFAAFQGQLVDLGNRERPLCVLKNRFNGLFL